MQDILIIKSDTSGVPGTRRSSGRSSDPAPPGGKSATQFQSGDLREVMNSLLYQDRTGCQWDMLPHDRLPKSTVFDSFKRWRDDGT
jgi:transposase